MPGQDVNQLLTVARTLPGRTSDGKAPQPNARAGTYLEQYMMSLVPTKHLLADEGSYFVATNPTPGTTIAGTVSAAFADTVPLLYLFNKATAGNARIYLDYIKLLFTVAPASATNANYAIKLDNVARFPTTNNMTTITPVSPNMDLGVSSQLQVLIQSSATASAIPAASGASRVVARGGLGQQPLAGDELVIAFGATDFSPYQGLTATEAAGFSRRVSVSPPIILGPQTSATVYLWFAANATTGPSYEFEMGWWER